MRYLLLLLALLALTFGCAHENYGGSEGQPPFNPKNGTTIDRWYAIDANHYMFASSQGRIYLAERAVGETEFSGVDLDEVDGHTFRLATSEDRAEYFGLTRDDKKPMFTTVRSGVKVTFHPDQGRKTFATDYLQ